MLITACYHWLIYIWKNRPQRYECDHCGLIAWDFCINGPWLCTPECAQTWLKEQGIPF